MSIVFNNADLSYRLSPQRKVVGRWIKAVALQEGYVVGDINIVFCSDNYLLEINRKFLNHDFLTDVITFDYTSQTVISGEIYISVDTVVNNAALFAQQAKHEMLRVVIHGVLHLCGYKDKSASQQKMMRAKENYYLMVLMQIKD